MSRSSHVRSIAAAYAGKKVWITGASSGIGAAFLDLLGAADIETIASAPESECEKIDAATYPSVRVLPFDLTDRQSIHGVVSGAWKLFGSVDVLINNAGISQRSYFAETDPAVLERVLDINLMGTMWLTQAVVKRMIERRTGRIVTISSYAAWVPVPQRTAYSAAKAALIAMNDALRPELLDHGVGVTVVVPGAVRTAISVNAVTRDGSPHARLDPNQAAGMAPEECAYRILRGAAAGRRQITLAVPPRLFFARIVRRLAPGLFDRIISRARVT